MNATLRITWLRALLRILSGGFLVAFTTWIALILLNASILAPGSQLAPLLRFQPYNPHYESMMAALYIVWAVMLWRASRDPARHPLFIDFTIWGSAAHGLVMLIATPNAKGRGNDVRRRRTAVGDRGSAVVAATGIITAGEPD